MASLLNVGRGLLEKLPYDAEIEYLGFTKTQYFNLPSIMFGDITSIDFVASVNSGAEMTIIGRREPSNQLEPSIQSVELFFYNGKVCFWDVYRDNAEAICLGKTYANYKFENGSVTITAISDSGTNIGSSTLNSDIINKTYSFYVGSYNGTQYIAFDGNLHSLKIYKNGIVWCDLIPVVKDNTGYMYDKVSGQLFGNAGTGDFILGPDK